MDILGMSNFTYYRGFLPKKVISLDNGVKPEIIRKKLTAYFFQKVLKDLGHFYVYLLFLIFSPFFEKSSPFFDKK
jgi:hypothetical protein